MTKENLCPLGEAGRAMNEPEGKLTLIDENHMLCASLISKYSFCQVKDVIEEACKHQRDADEAKLKDIMGQVKPYLQHKITCKKVMAAQFGTYDECTCGLEALKSKWGIK